MPGERTRGLVVSMRRGRSYPELRCHRCAQTIINPTMAGVAYAPMESLGETIVWPALILCKTNQCLIAPEYEHWLWMELDEFILHVLAGLGVTDSQRLAKFWKDAKQKIDEGP